jgi:hypothetical protein
LRRDCDIDRLNESEPRSEGKGRCRRIFAAQPDQRASVEIAGCGDPVAALPSPPGPLLERNEPLTLDSIGVSEEIGIGRAGLLDDADAAQKSDPAA